MSSEHLIDASGRKEIHRVLTTHGDLKDAISELQSTLGLSVPAMEPALAFLDLLKVPRAAVYQYLSDSLKNRLNSRIQSASPSSLESLLRLTFRFIAVNELKQIPISIIRALPRIPDVYLKALSDKRLRGIFSEFPLPVRRQILESSKEFFLEQVEPTLHALAAIDDAAARRDDVAFGGVCDLVSGSERLFVFICDWLARKVVTDGEAEWAAVLRLILIVIDSSGKKMKQFGKLHELARSLDECVTSKSFNLQLTIGIVRAIMTSHLSRGVAQVKHPSPGSAQKPTVSPAQAPTRKTARPTAAALPPSRSVAPVVKTEPIVKRKLAAAPVIAPLPVNADDITGPALTAVLQRAHKALLLCDKEKVFRTPVLDAFAPSYSSLIKEPMDIGTMKLKIPSYKTFAEFERDISLICDNCHTYNGRGTPYSILADDFYKAWQAKRTSILKASASKMDTEQTPIGAAADAASPAAASVQAVKKPPPARSLPRAKLIEILEEAWDALSNLDESGIFAAPVTDSVAPDYSKVVKNPMDISTIQSKIYKYRNFAEFDEDVTVMCENCYLYNGRYSYYGNIAADLFERWQKISSNYWLKCGETRPEPEVAELSDHADDASSVDMSDGDEGSIASVVTVASVDSKQSGGSNGGAASPERKRPIPPDNTGNGSEVEPSPKRPKRGVESVPQSQIPSLPLSRVVQVPPAPRSQDISSITSRPTGAVVSATVATGELQCVSCQGSLCWAVVLFYDPAIQSILINRLTSALFKICSDTINKLPYEDPACRVLLQLCELPAVSHPVIPAVNDHFIRRHIPALVFNALCDEDDEGKASVPDSSEADFSGLSVSKFLAVMQTLRTAVNRKLGSSTSQSDQK